MGSGKTLARCWVFHSFNISAIFSSSRKNSEFDFGAGFRELRMDSKVFQKVGVAVFIKKSFALSRVINFLSGKSFSKKSFFHSVACLS